MFREAYLRQLLAERARRAPPARSSFDLRRILCAPQYAAASSPHRRKILLCGRRAGKTTTTAAKLIDEAGKRPGIPVLYATMTRANSKEIVWPELLKLNEAHRLGGVPNFQDLALTMPNGSPIQLRGLANEAEVAKVRGKKFGFAAIDEAQSIPDRILRPFLTSDLGPTLRDYQAELWLVGTPSPVKAGYFFECYGGTHASRWEHHRWTMRENTFFPAFLAGVSYEEIIAEVLAENGWTEDDPTFQREYLGNPDVEDLDSLLFQFQEGRNTYVELPSGGRWRYVFGIDQGTDDADYIAVLGWQEGDPTLYLVEEHHARDNDVTDLASAIARLIATYRPLRCVIDQGGGGKKAVMELIRRHGLPLTAAEKSQKPHHIRLLNADLRKGRLKVRADSVFASDVKLVQKDTKALQRGLLQERDGGFHSDACDGVLYGWREALHYLEKPSQDARAAHLTDEERAVVMGGQRKRRGLRSV